MFEPFWVSFYIRCEVELHSFAWSYPVVPAPFFLKQLFLSRWTVLESLSKISWLLCTGYFWTINSISLIFMSLLSTTLSWLLLFFIKFEIKKSRPSGFVLCQNCLGVLGLLHFPMNFRIIWSISAEKPVEILMGIWFILSGEYSLILIPSHAPIHEDEISFYLFRSPSIFKQYFVV